MRRVGCTFPGAAVASTLSLTLGGATDGSQCLAEVGLASGPMVQSQFRFKVKGQMKPKKRPKPSKKFIEDSQKYREEWQVDTRRVVADSLRGYMDFSSTTRTQPWDNRFAPFDRVENDGAYVLMDTFMSEKLALCNNHPRPTKRLFCNLGLLGPTVTTVARWKPKTAATLPIGAKTLDRVKAKDPDMRNGGFND
jgi:hypothetical protein